MDNSGNSTQGHDQDPAVERWIEYLRMFDVEIDPDEPLAEIGIDSLTAAELSAELEDEFGVVIPMDRFFGEKTLREVSKELEQSGLVPG
jgi:acyl carrier protein